MKKNNVWLGCLCLCGAVALGAQPSSKVKTRAGWVAGTVSVEQSVHIFKGIPYAAPPVGELRWQSPQPTKRWKGVRDCTAFGASAIQSPPVPFAMWTAEFIAPAHPLSEDCLTLNVWTPAPDKGKRPVLVWIHGGGLVSGAGSCAVYDGAAFARAHDVVVVTINYRLGIFGFFTHPDLNTQSPKGTSGNYGILDQIAALRWVRDNIAAFGGDPSQVTIAGQSAGSFSVYALLASPLAKGLFHRAIAQSGGLLGSGRVLNAVKSAEIGRDIAHRAGAISVAQLRLLPADTLLAIAQTMPWGSFSLVADGYVLPTDIVGTFRQRQHNDVPTLAGWVAGDGALMGTPATAASLQTIAHTRFGNAAAAFLQLFPATDDATARQSGELLQLLDFAALSAHRLGSWQQSATYLYHFAHVPADKPDFPNYGAFHTAEVPFVLNNLSLWNRPWRDVDHAIAAQMFAYWGNFVKTGNPNGSNLPTWTPYTSIVGQQATLVVETQQTRMVNGLFEKTIRFLDEAK